MKSLLGSSLIDGSTEVQGRSIPFRVLLTRFIAELKRRAETAAGRDFQRVVLGRPVFFVDDDPAADQTAQDTFGRDRPPGRLHRHRVPVRTAGRGFRL